MFDSQKEPSHRARSQVVADAISVGIQTLRERGRARGTLEDEHGHVCVRGALNNGLVGDPRGITPQAASARMRAEVAIAEVAIAEVAGVTSIPHFNDNPATTDEQVFAAMSEALVNVTPIPDTIPNEFMREMV